MKETYLIELWNDTTYLSVKHQGNTMNECPITIDILRTENLKLELFKLKNRRAFLVIENEAQQDGKTDR